jgi:hypothetical protein
VCLFISAAAFAITPTLLPQPPSATPLLAMPTPTWGAAVNDSRLADHVPLVGSFTRPGDVFRYTLEVVAGQPVTIGVSAMPGWVVRPRLEVYNPDGEQVAAADSDSTGEAIIPGLLPATSGVYLVYVTAENTTGDFMISYGVGTSREDVGRGSIEPDRPTNSTLARRGQREVWTLLLRQDDVISAAAGPLAVGMSVGLELVAPDGSVIAQGVTAIGGRDTAIPAAQAPATGLYSLRVTMADAAVGSYKLVWHYVNLAPSPTLPPALIPILAADDYAPQDQYLFYPFQGQAGQRVQIRVIAPPGSTLDPVAALVGPDGAELANADDTNGSPNAEMIITLPADGTYRVRVNGYLSAGAFSLTVDALV